MALSVMLGLALQSTGFASGPAISGETRARTEYGLSEEAVDFLREHNVDLSVFNTSSAAAVNAENPAQTSLNEPILGLIRETEAYGFSDEQIQQYVTGLVNSDPVTVSPGEAEMSTLASPPISTGRNSDGPGFEVESLAGYYQSTAFATLPAAYNAGQSNAWMFYTVSSSSWGIDVGINYAPGAGGVNAWRGFYTAQGGTTVCDTKTINLLAGSKLYFNALLETSGYLYFRVLDGNDFSKEYYALRYYVSSKGITRSNGIFNRQITMTNKYGKFTDGSYIRNASFADAYIYGASGYSRTVASNTNSSRRGVLKGTTVSSSLTTVNSYTPWYAENISISFS